MIRGIFHFSVLAAITCFVTACASVSVRETTPHLPRKAPISVPKKIYVAEYGAPESAFEVDRSGEKLQQFIKQKRAKFAKVLAQRISKRVAPAVPLPPASTPPKGNVWLVTGTFDSVRQGSRALRAIIGFGMGRTLTETTTHVYDLSKPVPQLIFSVKTTGGSGALPGAVGAITPLGWNPLTIVGMITNAAGGASSGLDMDSTRTAREIAAAISEFAAERKLIPPNRAKKPKRLGELPPLDLH